MSTNLPTHQKKNRMKAEAKISSCFETAQKLGGGGGTVELLGRVLLPAKKNGEFRYLNTKHTHK